MCTGISFNIYEEFGSFEFYILKIVTGMGWWRVNKLYKTGKTQLYIDIHAHMYF